MEEGYDDMVDMSPKGICGHKTKKRISLRTRLTVLAGTALFLSNAFLVTLLLVNSVVAMQGFILEIEGLEYEMYTTDGFEMKLFMYGLMVALFATTVGTALVWHFLGKYLGPLRRLSEHMKKADRENMPERLEITSDVSETEDLISSFNSMTEKLRLAFESQSEQASFIAHEFRTPLAVTQAGIDLWRKEGSGDAGAIMEKISSQVKRLDVLISAVLDLTGIQRSELTDCIPMGILAEEVLVELDDEADRKGITLFLEKHPAEKTGPEKELLVRGNHDLLYRALFNLVENAIKYNREGGSVKVRMAEEDGRVAVAVSDTGCGIPDSGKDRIFDLFYRCPDAPAKGSGVGLAFSKKVLEHHGASLSVVSEEGEGTTFVFSLEGWKKEDRS